METLQLHGWFYKQLQEALISAFPTAVSLEQFVSFNLNQNLNELAGGENLSDIVYQLMESQKACGEVCIKRLVDEASQYREYNQQVQAVKKIFDKTLDKVEYSLEFDNPVDEIEDFKVKYSIEELSENLEDPCLNYIKKDGTKIYLIGSKEGLETFKRRLHLGELQEIVGYPIKSLEDADGINLFKVPIEPSISIEDRINQLIELLTEKKWKEADEETSKILLQAASQEERGWLQRDDIEQLDSDILLKVDEIWLNHSQNNFGFSVQKFIWEQIQKNSNSHLSYTEKKKEFTKQLRWYVEKKGGNGETISKAQIVWSFAAQIQGYLPTPPPAMTGDNVIKVCVTLALVERLAKCKQQSIN